jgi:hypothetical protein
MKNNETECYHKALGHIYRLYKDWNAFHEEAYIAAIGALAIQALNEWAPKAVDPEGRE